MLPDLRLDIPRLEPDPVLLDQLAQLSRGSARPAGPGPARSFVAAVTVLVVAGFSWLTGTLPGVASPFQREPSHQPTHQPVQEQDPVTPPDGQPGLEGSFPGLPGVLPPGLAKPHHDQGNHLGQTETHPNNGNHTGQVKPHSNNGNHTGQVKPNSDNGNHTGQVKPHPNSGNHTGQTAPAPTASPDPDEHSGQSHGTVR